MTFTVASYNILADGYINAAWYPGIDPQFLDPAHRHPALLARIAQLAADVVCLQEIESDVYWLLAEHLASRGYEGKYAGKGAGKADGCATFARVAAVPFRTVRILHYADGSGTQPHSGNVALVTAVEQAGRQVAIANTHLKWDPPGTPPAKQLGLRQMRELLDARAGLAPGCASWIICGDLNVTAQSSVVQALQTADLADAYGGRPELASCVANGKAKRIDYLFHTADLRARPMDVPAIHDQTLLPSRKEPSDHLPITAEFDWNLET
ncbi:MAG: endonuclease/exonuclease/phosphatase family protein [Gemmataceae bacterium]|nr:endonuclease/exonuclease/phosphatase family protein [Gemmataceae bacterium]